MGMQAAGEMAGGMSKRGRWGPMADRVRAQEEELRAALTDDQIRLAEAVDAVGTMAELPGLSLEGMMTMAPLDAGESILRATFGAARELRETVAREVAAFRPSHLSMGMSGDYEIAVEEGSTIVRLGTVLFGARER